MNHAPIISDICAKKNARNRRQINLFLDELGAADFVNVAVYVESCRREIFKRDGAAAHCEGNGFGFLVIRRLECEIVKCQRVIVVEAENNILAVALRVVKFVRAGVAPK